MSQGAYIIRELKQRRRGRQWERQNTFMMCFFTKIQIRNFTPSNGYFVSLLKSQNGLLIQIISNGGGFFPLDPIQNWILWMIHFIPSVLLIKLRIREECILPAVLHNNLNTRYISSLTRLLIFKAIFKTKAQIKRFILSIYRVAVCGVLQDFTFPLHISLQDSSSFRPFKAISLCSSHRIQWKVNKLKAYNTISSRIILSPGYRRYCGSFLWKQMN